MATIKDLVPDPKNRRTHTTRNIEMLQASLEKVGTGRSIVIDEDDVVLAGNATVKAAGLAGLTKLKIVEAAGDEVIAVRRRGLTSEQKRDLALYDNRTAELAEWDVEQLVEDVEVGVDLEAFFRSDELLNMSSSADADLIMEMSKGADVSKPDPDENTASSGFMSFSCPLSMSEHLLVHKVLRKAKAVFSCSSSGKALVELMTQWDSDHGSN
jgi:ParB-like chromosome segregation protein Spo0J